MYHAKATINLVTPRLATSCSFGSSGTISKHHASNMLLICGSETGLWESFKVSHGQDFTACNKAAAVSRQPSFSSLTFCSLFTSNSCARQLQRLRSCSASRFLFCLLPCVDRWCRMCRALTSIQICNRLRFCQIPQGKLGSKLTKMMFLISGKQKVQSVCRPWWSVEVGSICSAAGSQVLLCRRKRAVKKWNWRE